MSDHTEHELSDSEVTKAVVRRIPRLAKILIALLLSGGTATAGVVLSQGDSPKGQETQAVQNPVDADQWKAIKDLGVMVNSVATRTSVLESTVGDLKPAIIKLQDSADTLLRGVSDLQGQLRVILRRDQP